MHSTFTSLARPKEVVWYSKVPLGHNVLGKVISGVMKQAGLKDTTPIHQLFPSLRVSLASTRLFNAQADEQLIMSRTGHSSTDGVRAYKRASNKLKKVTSDVLNWSKDETIKSASESQAEPPLKRPCF